MVIDSPFIFQIVGYQNSGKTTLVEQVLNRLKANGKRTVVIKHHGHGGKPSLDEDKDSFRHVKAGAAASIVEGGGRLILHAEKQEWSLNEKIRMASSLSPDLILIEGHKHEEFPKAVLIRTNDDLQLLNDLTNIEIQFYWEKQLQSDGFHIEDIAGLEWLVSYLLKSIEEGKRSPDQ
ncbi:molybdopterin-guanine dinucleotide biosynthesis protein B [Cytobacillus gottheilii]|uniref:molybdopterin-guanine dinucleotide biosynthesis protein B n=1 Tax=Cytobacillus gottheilii TaxID=859144 RepID=UPI0009BC396F|nr:molybdopterin-guanine dinucleotide biosynthesis protein B [Cytobacillus gottheilii]